MVLDRSSPRPAQGHCTKQQSLSEKVTQIPLETLKRAGVNHLEAIISTPGGPDDGGASSSSSDVAEATGLPTQSPPALTGGQMLFAGVAVEPHAEAEDHPDDDAEEDNNSATGAGEGGEPVDGSASTLETSSMFFFPATNE